MKLINKNYDFFYPTPSNIQQMSAQTLEHLGIEVSNEHINIMERHIRDFLSQKFTATGMSNEMQELWDKIFNNNQQLQKKAS